MINRRRDILSYSIDRDIMTASSFIYQEIAHRMLQRLEFIKLEPKIILEINTSFINDTQMLSQYFNNQSLIISNNTHKAPQLTNRESLTNFYNNDNQLIYSSIENLPIHSCSVDLVWANLLVNDIYNIPSQQAIRQIYDCLNIEGSMICSALTTNSLFQLRELGLTTVEFIDCSELINLFSNAQFKDIVVEVESITLEYQNFHDMLYEVRNLTYKNHIINYINKNHYKELMHKSHDPINISLEIAYLYAYKTLASNKNLQSKPIKFVNRKL